MNPAVTAAALASAEANTAALVSKAAQLEGKPEQADAWILVRAAERITNNLRAVHEANERRNQ